MVFTGYRQEIALTLLLNTSLYCPEDTPLTWLHSILTPWIVYTCALPPTSTLSGMLYSMLSFIYSHTTADTAVLIKSHQCPPPLHLLCFLTSTPLPLVLLCFLSFLTTPPTLLSYPLTPLTLPLLLHIPPSRHTHSLLAPSFLFPIYTIIHLMIYIFIYSTPKSWPYV